MPDTLVEPIAGAVHGVFSRDLPPVVHVRSGDRIRFGTLDAGWGLEPQPDGPPYDRALLPRPAGHDGHALTGPVHVAEARPGDALELRIDAIAVGAYGWTKVGGRPSALNERLGVVEEEEFLVRWALDPATGWATSHHGDRVPLAPFPGVVGLAPGDPGLHSTTPPRRVGGNLDCKELVAGSTLFLPVEVEGGLLSVGDGHAAQGDGEVCGWAVECPFDEIALTVTVHRDDPGPLPRAETPAGTLTFGFADTLDEAAVRALEAMVELLCTRYGIARRRAIALASTGVDLRITQVVNRMVGVHALLPRQTLLKEGSTK
jgi:acetamidase/formamidase